MDGERGKGWSAATIRRATIVLSIVLVALVSWLAYDVVSRERVNDEPPPPAPVAESTPTPQPVSTTPAPTATPTESPSPSPTETEPTGETVLFMGGPAHGPWQQIGSVSEITHPGAPASARYAYDEAWSDPSEENQPPWLWDALTVEVAEQALELGEPVNHPAFGGAPGSEPFNSFGGVEDISYEGGFFTALWRATFEDDQGVASAHWIYVIDFDSNVLLRDGPLVIREEDVADSTELIQRALAWMRDAAAAGGYACDEC